MIIHGSDINPDALIGIESLADLKKLNIFSHLTNENEANEDLWKVLHPDEPEPELTDDDLPEDGND